MKIWVLDVNNLKITFSWFHTKVVNCSVNFFSNNRAVPNVARFKMILFIKLE